MKTLKELLFERHRGAEPELDLARQEFLARLREAQSPPRQERRGLERLWHEYLPPLRWHLAGMSAVWLAVLLLHFDTSPAPAARVGKASVPDSRQVLAALREKRQEILDLTAPPAALLSLPPRHSEAAPATYSCSVGVRPSSGAATIGCSSPALLEFHVAAPEEGRTPLNSYRAIAIG
jgi:hypothetical protein